MTVKRNNSTNSTVEPLIAADPPHDCPLCPRLAGFRAGWQTREPDWHNGPVDTWLPAGGAGQVGVLIVGLAPGLRGANRTGRPFTGDASGTALFSALSRCGLAHGTGDELVLDGTAITNAVRCVPPENRPTGAEIKNCRRHLQATIARFARLQGIVSLGSVAHRSVVAALGGRQADHPFGHGARSELEGLALIASYHCSRYNMNTGRLTQAMLEEVIGRTAAAVRPR